MENGFQGVLQVSICLPQSIKTKETERFVPINTGSIHVEQQSSAADCVYFDTISDVVLIRVDLLFKTQDYL